MKRRRYYILFQEVLVFIFLFKVLITAVGNTNESLIKTMVLLLIIITIFMLIDFVSLRKHYIRINNKLKSSAFIKVEDRDMNLRRHKFYNLHYNNSADTADFSKDFNNKVTIYKKKGLIVKHGFIKDLTISYSDIESLICETYRYGKLPFESSFKNVTVFRCSILYKDKKDGRIKNIISFEMEEEAHTIAREDKMIFLSLSDKLAKHLSLILNKKMVYIGDVLN